MNIKTPSFLLIIFCLISLPAFLKAQDNKAQDNAHCVVKKSPYRLSMDSGKEIYTLQCLTCHQADGLGAPPMNPPLNNKQVSGDKTKLIGILIKGLATHEETDGVKYQNVMLPHPEMKDQEIADVLTYVRNSFGNKASSVRVSDVKSVRSKMK
jgi:mono/diheme cytochrome c family protein